MGQAGQPPLIVVVGGVNMDVIGVAPEFPAAGETVVGERYYTAPGGKGANQAVAAARLGARVRMIGRVGSDLFGPMLVEGLRDEGIDVSRVAVDPEHGSGVAIILLDAQRQNRIVIIPGANMRRDDAQVGAAESALDGADCLMLQMETPLEVSLAAARAARRRGVTVVWDPAPAAGMAVEALAAADVATPNQTEAESLTGIAVVDVRSAGDAAHALLRSGVGAAVVTLGEMGAYYASSEGESGHVAPYEVEAVDSVAAGDAFNGALAVALAEGASLESAVRYGSAAGSLAVTRPGAQEAMPRREDVERVLVR